MVVASLLAGSAAEAGPWNRDVGSAYLKLGFSYFATEQGFAQGVSTGLEYEAFTYNLFAEIGLPHRFSLVMDLPYVVARNDSTSGFTYGQNTFGDARFELDFQLLPTAPLSLGFETKVPLYSPVRHQDVDGLLEVDGRSYPADNFPEVGDGNVDLTPKLLAGWSFSPLFPGWITAELGYRIRLRDYADGVYGAMSFGSFIWPNHLALGVYLSGIINVQDDPDPDVQASREFVYGQAYLLVTGAPWLPRLGLTFSVGSILSAVNSSEGMDFGLGLSYEI